jgi:lysozyme family protein
MMKDVGQLIEDILRREGGFVDHPADRGGPTKYGITHKTLSQYVGHAVLRKDVENLKEDLAREIYERNYYFAPRIDRLPEAIQPFVFDSAVNHGPRRAIIFVQSVCNQAGYQPHLFEDGAMGPNTRKATEWTESKMGDLFLPALVKSAGTFTV